MDEKTQLLVESLHGMINEEAKRSEVSTRLRKLADLIDNETTYPAVNFVFETTPGIYAGWECIKIKR